MWQIILSHTRWISLVPEIYLTMLTFEHEFDLEEIYELVKQEGEGPLSRSDCGLKCIGFQTDLVLFSYNTVVDDKMVTKLGYYCFHEKMVTDLYVHQGVMEVLVGSINPEKNLLGMTKCLCWSVFYFTCGHLYKFFIFTYSEWVREGLYPDNTIKCVFRLTQC